MSLHRRGLRQDANVACAQQIAVLSEKLMSKELDILVLLGGMIHRRTDPSPKRVD